MSTATPSNNKRKRSDEQQNNVADHWMMWNLPASVQYSILCFLPHLERLPLTLTCQSGCKMVEEYSKKVMDKIFQTHFVDDDFEQRLIVGPLELVDGGREPPHRVRLKMALHSHLYKIARKVIPRYGTYLKISPCEKYLLLSIENCHTWGILSLWNLDTRRAVWAKSVEDGGFINAFFVVRETVVAVVACQRHQITVYGMTDGEVTARHALPEDQQLPQKRMLGLIRDRFLVYFAHTSLINGRLDLSVFDVLSDVHTSVPLLAQPMPRDDRLLNVQATCVLANRWLVVVFLHWLDQGTYFRIYDGQEDEYTQRAGYHSEHQYDSIYGFQGDTLAARRKNGDEPGNTIDVFKFNEETFQFYLSSTFDVDPSLTRTLGIRNHALHLHGGGAQWSGDQNYPNPTNLLLYNMETGEHENKYYWHTSFGEFRATDCVVSPTKQELLVGIRKEDDEVPDSERNVAFLAAFLLKEPLLED